MPGRGELVHLQALRGIAALAVVIHHILVALGRTTALPATGFGAAGVWVFFVISGFVMLHACRDEPAGTFLLRRVIRVVPLYWLMTLPWFLLLLRRDIAAGQPLAHLAELGQSLLFLPHYHVGAADRIWPLLVPGWTLNFEMFFFLLFALGIAARRLVPVTAGLILILVAAGLAYRGQDPRILTWTSPLLLLFLAGMGLAHLRARGLAFAGLSWALPAGAGLLLAGGLGLVPEIAGPALRAAGAVLLLAGVLALEERRPGQRNRWLAAMGDASYAIYLSHTLLLVFLMKGLALLPPGGAGRLLFAVPLCTLACIGAGIVLHRTVERPLTGLLRARFAAGGARRMLPAG